MSIRTSNRFWLKTRQSLGQRLGVNLQHPQAAYADVLAATLKPGDRWLDIGCGRQIIPDWAMPPETQRKLVEKSAFLVGMDVDNALFEHPLLTHRIMGLGGSLPFPANTFDLVTANMVMEHIPHPQPFLLDVKRILRPGGSFLFHTPNSRYFMTAIAARVPDGPKKRIVKVLESREEEDVFPTHYRINTQKQIHDCARAVEFQIDTVSCLGSYGHFKYFGPLGVAEVFVLKLFTYRMMAPYRSNFIVRFKKPLEQAASSGDGQTQRAVSSEPLKSSR